MDDSDWTALVSEQATYESILAVPLGEALADPDGTLPGVEGDAPSASPAAQSPYAPPWEWGGGSRPLLCAAGVRRAGDRLRVTLYGGSRTARALGEGVRATVNLMGFDRLGELFHAAFLSLTSSQGIPLPAAFTEPSVRWSGGRPFVEDAILSLGCTVVSARAQSGTDGLGPFERTVFELVADCVLARGAGRVPVNRASGALLEAAIIASRIPYTPASSLPAATERFYWLLETARTVGGACEYLLADGLEEVASCLTPAGR